MGADFYKELGVERSASKDEIRRAYKKLAAKLHPDRNPGDEANEQRFKNVNRAYTVLSDEKKRKLYDEFGEDGLREGFDPDAFRAYRSGGRRVRFDPSGFGGGGGGFGGAGFGDLFSEIFGGAAGPRPGGQAAQRRGQDTQSEVAVDFRAAIEGATLELRIGGEPVTVRIPAGAGDGDKVRVKGKGQPSPYGGPAGDLMLVVRVRAHRHFERDGLDLRLDLPITVGEAYRGGKARVPTPGGWVNLTIPEHAQSGQVVRLKGRGVKRGDKQGDLYVRFMIRLPEHGSPQLDLAVDALEGAIDGELRGDLEL